MSLVLRSLLPYPHSCQGSSPYQQGWDTKMAILSFCGMDVSKDRLDVVVLPEGRFCSVSNDAAGWAERTPPDRRPVRKRSESCEFFAAELEQGVALSHRSTRA